MADTSNLSKFLSDVADAIRTKKATTDKIPAENFDTEILSIESDIAKGVKLFKTSEEMHTSTGNKINDLALVYDDINFDGLYKYEHTINQDLIQFAPINSLIVNTSTHEVSHNGEKMFTAIYALEDIKSRIQRIHDADGGNVYTIFLDSDNTLKAIVKCDDDGTNIDSAPQYLHYANNEFIGFGTNSIINNFTVDFTQGNFHFAGISSDVLDAVKTLPEYTEDNYVSISRGDWGSSYMVYFIPKTEGLKFYFYNSTNTTAQIRLSSATSVKHYLLNKDTLEITKDTTQSLSIIYCDAVDNVNVFWGNFEIYTDNTYATLLFKPKTFEKAKVYTLDVDSHTSEIVESTNSAISSNGEYYQKFDVGIQTIPICVYLDTLETDVSNGIKSTVYITFDDLRTVEVEHMPSEYYEFTGWSFAPTQLTLSDENELAKDVIAYGSFGVITGTAETGGVMSEEDYNACDELATEILGDAIAYTELEWIQNTDTNYINTGITPDSDVDIEASFVFTGDAFFGRLWGTVGEDCKYELASHDVNRARISIGGTSSTYTFNVSTTEFNTVKMTGTGKCYYKEELIQDFAKSYTGTKPILLFYGYNNYGLAKIAYCKIWKNGELVRDLVPAKDANNIVCMFDKVNYTFYYNQQTYGEFIGGGEK